MAVTSHIVATDAWMRTRWVLQGFRQVSATQQFLGSVLNPWAGGSTHNMVAL
jgi:hypothetical protein